MTHRSLLLVATALVLAACQAPAQPGNERLPGVRFALGAVTALEPVTVASSPTTGPNESGAGPEVPTVAPATAAPAAGGGSVSGGGGAPPRSGGQVLAFSATDERPLAGAQVTTTDGRSAVSAADGSFTLPGPAPADGVYVASCAGYATLVMTGQAPGAVRLSLQPNAGGGAPAAGQRFTVHGQLLSPTGSPVVDAFVAIGDTHGTTCVPAISGVDGKFDLLVTAPGGAVAGGTLLAAARSGAFLGLANGVAVSADQPDLAPLNMVAADHPLDVTLDSHVMGSADVPQAIDLVAADGTRLGIALRPGTARVAEIAGASYCYRAEAVDPAIDATSTVYLADLPIDFATPDTHLNAALLAPPDLSVPAVLVPDLAINWPAVPGADGYHLSLTGTDAAGFAWEAFTAGTSLRFALPEPLAAGHYDLVLAALDGAARIPRSLANVAPAPGSPIPSYRKATRRKNVSL